MVKKIFLSLIIIITVALIATVIIFVFKTHPSSLSDFLSPSSTDNKILKIAGHEITYRFNFFTHNLYQVEQKTTVRIHSKNQGNKASSISSSSAAGEQIQEINIKGDLLERIHDIKGDSILVSFAFDKVKLEWGKNLNKQEMEISQNLERQLSKEIFVLINSSRQFKEFYVAKEYSAEAANIIKAIALSTQIVLPQKVASVSSWVTHEKNMTGPFKATYSLTANDGNGNKDVGDRDVDNSDNSSSANLLEIKKQKLYYKHFEMDDRGMVISDKIEDLPSQEISLEPSSFNKIVYDPSKGNFVSINEFESHRIRTLNVEISSQIKTKITLLKQWQKNFSAITFDNLKIESEQKKLLQTAIVGGEISSEQRQNMLKRLIAQMTTEGIINKLETVDFAKDGQKVFNYFGILRAILELSPKEYEKILDVVSGLDPNDLKYQEKVAFLIGSLNRMNAEDAQDGLMNLINSNIGNKILMEQAIITLAELKNPTSEQQRFLVNLFHSTSASEYHIKSLSALGLGLLANNAQSSAPQLAAESTSELIRELEKAQSDREKLTILTALGNTGIEQSLSTLQKYLSDKNEEIRALAVYGLRFIPGENGLNLISATISNDKSPQVLDQALQALSFQPVSEKKLSLLINLFSKNANPSIQEKSLRIMNDLYTHYPEQVKTVFKDAKKSSHEKIRNLVIDLELTH
ncbi:MAG: HEAT repeat domain-containing protein [Oligoflexia bacterium]|nr:HEAT repeat domain-containing protein [Oligoflexia bacterium]